MGNLGQVPNYIGAVTSGANTVLAMPIVGKVDTYHLLLLVGVVMVGIIVWSRVLAHMSVE